VKSEICSHCASARGFTRCDCYCYCHC